MTPIALVVAQARNGVIGRDGGLPWRIPSELKRFKAITLGKPIIMGRRTWEGLPRKPLRGRRNIVITRDSGFAAPGAVAAVDADAAVALADAEKPTEIAVIGGGEIYRLFLPRASRIYLTDVDLEAAGDTHFPPLDPAQWREISREAHTAVPGDSAGYVLRVLERNVSPGSAP